MKRLIYLLVFVCFLGCSQEPRPDLELLRNEILETEKAFEAAAASHGIAHAFYTYAADSAVIKRGKDSLIQGRDGIKNFYLDPKYKDAQVNWTPDFIEVSADGSLGYTYGKYLWKMRNDAGEEMEFTGVFHTIWKKQADGTWKYVWD